MSRRSIRAQSLPDRSVHVRRHRDLRQSPARDQPSRGLDHVELRGLDLVVALQPIRFGLPRQNRRRQRFGIVAQHQELALPSLSGPVPEGREPDPHVINRLPTARVKHGQGTVGLEAVSLERGECALAPRQSFRRGPQRRVPIEQGTRQSLVLGRALRIDGEVGQHRPLARLGGGEGLLHAACVPEVRDCDPAPPRGSPPAPSRNITLDASPGRHGQDPAQAQRWIEHVARGSGERSGRAERERRGGAIPRGR